MTMTDDLDLATITALAARGADLGKPRKTVHYVYAPNRAAADQLASRVRQAGRTIDVRQLGKEWAVVVTETLIVSPRTISDLRRELESAAKNFGGDYDGWEASV
jgi:hypothetical protein